MPVDALPNSPPVLEAHQTATPLALFQAACIDGSARLDPNSVKKVKFSSLPVNARQVFRYAMPVGKHNMPQISSLLETSRAPKVIYKLSFLEESYLLLPDNGRDHNFANACAVITEGRVFEKAAASVGLGHDRPTSLRGEALPYVSTVVGGYHLVAAEYMNWTLASAVPDPSPTGEKTK